MENVYAAMGYQYTINFNCYYGAIKFLNADNLLKLFTELNILVNISFNIGAMWTDVVMLVIGRPGETESDYFYYVAYYIADFLFRFLFRESAEGLCWLPWNSAGCNYY